MSKVRFHVHLEPEKVGRLRELAEQRGVATGVLVREGIDRVIELAEKQAATVEKAKRSVTSILWVQQWEETERGWGTRPDGYTLHANKEDVQLYLQEMRARECEGKAANYVPDEYSRPIGAPYEASFDDADLVARVRASRCGIWGGGPEKRAPCATR